LVNTVLRRSTSPAAAVKGLAGMMRALLIALVAASLVSGIAGGLLRVGVRLAPAPADWLGRAALAHAALMVCGFLGTVIGIERAVAVKRRGAFVAPLASGLGGGALLLGHETFAAGLLVGAALVFFAVSGLVVQRQRAAHTVLLLVAALAWLVGNLLFAVDAPSVAVLPWWFNFLVMTIAAERLEMTRLMRRRPAAQAALYGVLAAMLTGAAASAIAPRSGGALYGLALALLALWLALFDIARRTVSAPGLSRYMALCLLGGYAWLAVAGGAWLAVSWGLAARDMALHALGLGFIISMVMGHAPVILPAVAGIKLAFGPFFYLPLIALHASLMLRLFVGFDSVSWRAIGASLNAASIAWFALTVLASALWWTAKHRAAR
jgi:hypothetical protein